MSSSRACTYPLKPILSPPWPPQSSTRNPLSCSWLWRSRMPSHDRPEFCQSIRDRHYNHGDGTYPLPHNPVTSFYVSGPVRFPLDLRLYRRYEELTQWEAAVAKHFPDLTIPRETKGRNRLHKQVDPILLQDAEFRARHEQFQTKISLAIELVEAAIRGKVPFGVVVFDAWYLAEDLIQVLARRHKDWISVLKKNRLVETGSFHLRDVNGWPLKLPGPHLGGWELGRPI